MTHLWQLSAIAVAAIALLGACVGGDEPASPQSIQIADPHGGAPRDVTVLATERGATDGYAEVRIGGRDFTLVQWIEAGSGTQHDVVASTDGAIRYEYVADAAGGHVVVSDASGTRVIAAGASLGALDEDAAALLMSFRSIGGEGDVAYSYQTTCVYYDTSNPADWHLALAPCTCAHWYSLICTLD